MNESEKERILRLVAEGAIRPNEASYLLAALAEETVEPENGDKSREEKTKEKEKDTAPLVEVHLQRADGTQTTVQVPANLVPMFWQIAKVAIKESARNAAKDVVAGTKIMVRRKAEEVRANVRARWMAQRAEETAVQPDPIAEQGFEARRRVLQLVQNGRISATDASRLIEELDALRDYQRAHPDLPAVASK